MVQGGAPASQVEAHQHHDCHRRSTNPPSYDNITVHIQFRHTPTIPPTFAPLTTSLSDCLSCRSRRYPEQRPLSMPQFRTSVLDSWLYFPTLRSSSHCDPRTRGQRAACQTMDGTGYAIRGCGTRSHTRLTSRGACGTRWVSLTCTDSVRSTLWQRPTRGVEYGRIRDTHFANFARRSSF